MFMFFTIILLGLNLLKTLGSRDISVKGVPFLRKLKRIFIALILSLYSGLILITETRDAKKESMRLLEELEGSWLRFSA